MIDLHLQWCRTRWWWSMHTSCVAMSMSWGDCNRTHQNSHGLQWSKSWARDIQWPCRWSQLYCHPDLFSERSLVQLHSKNDERCPCMCSYIYIYLYVCVCVCILYARKVGIYRSVDSVVPRIGVVAGYATGLTNTVPQMQSMMLQQVPNEDKFDLI